MDNFYINKKIDLKKVSLSKPPQSCPWQSIVKIVAKEICYCFRHGDLLLWRTAKGMTILQKMKMNNFQPPIDANNYLIRCNFFGRIQVNI